ncbi:FAD binding domain-containing protein [Pleurostoma richardsiae]|uniref:FAD binding domain-containing protein n=1 Tax=Pleurostoma richardsiae TaxID=41990 RepID=A0AA38RCK7_9PEZI|nr:FAD binding domain-containing protein [Pleurostoma richardsiae]
MAEERVDVLICGSGSAGLCAALWLARCGVNYKIVERRPGPLKNGQADGVQCRTVEIFESFGISESLLKEAYHVLEVAFWASDGKGSIQRTHYAPDLEPGLSHQPHVILNQARLNGLMIEEIQRCSGRIEMDYGVEVKHVEVDDTAAEDYEASCVTTKAVTADGTEKVFKSKYVLACDGAHSVVRKSLGFNMVGDSTDAVWGVMDIYPRTSFPDIRKKAILHSDAGNLMIIPREGDYLVRFYVELQGASVKDVTFSTLEEKARRIFNPYFLEIVETVWWSAYSIGQRLADFFSKGNRVFLTGDACHTHSPKAGQGMNVSLQDGYNIGWKLAAVLRGQTSPEILDTYVSERQRTAHDLIEFDRFFTKLFSSTYRQAHGITTEEFKNQFVKAGRYTAGQGVKYDTSQLVSLSDDAKKLATGLEVGMRFPSAQVIGLELDVIVQKFTPKDVDPDSFIQGLLVLASNRRSVEQEQIPQFFTPVTGKWGIKCLHKTFADDDSYNSGHGHAYKSYGIDSKEGCLVIVRPDQYISKITSLEDTEGIRAFFEGFLLPVNKSNA